jgi:hypothetical protein
MERLNQPPNGEAVGNLPGSKSMAREERADGNLGDPEKSRRANCGHETGRGVQRKEERPDANRGVRLAVEPSVASCQELGSTPQYGADEQMFLCDNSH